MESITASTGATVQGQLMARTGAVTLDNNTITNGLCTTTPVTPPATGTVTATGKATATGAVKKTVTGGQLPKTSTPLYDLLFLGAALTLVGVVGWRSRKRYA